MDKHVVEITLVTIIVGIHEHLYVYLMQKVEILLQIQNCKAANYSNSGHFT